MKVRVKLSGTARVLDVGESDQCTLQQLIQRAADAFQLADISFSLSLNKQDSLSGDDKTLSDLGIVPGDLIFILHANENGSSNHSAVNGVNKATTSASVNSCTSEDNFPVNDRSRSSFSSMTCEPNTSGGSQQSDEQNADTITQTSSENFQASESESNTETMSTVGTDELHAAERDCVSPSPLEDPVVNRCLMEPLLCRESSANSVPALLRDIFETAGCSNMADALWLVVHTLMLEVGFKRLQDDRLELESGWNRRGFYQQEYRHICVNTQHSSTAMGITMGQVLIVHGITSGDPSVKTEVLQLKVTDFVHGPNVHQDVCNVYKNLEKLSRIVKDSVCQQLLSHLSEVCGYPVSLGLLSLSYELKLKVLSYLPASSLTRVGQVCRVYSATYKDPCLWRRLYLREFGQNGDNSLNKNWYQLYKDAYQLRKERRKLSRHRQQVLTGIPPWLNPPPGHFPPLTPAPYPGGVIGGDYDLNPEFSSGIPHPLFGRHRAPNPFLPQAPGAPGGPFMPRPRFDDPFGPEAGPGPGPPFWALGSGASRHSRASPFGSLGGHRFL